MLMVLTVHVRGYLTNTPKLLYTFMGIGAYGVALYFMISGYLMPNTVDKYLNYWQYAKSRLIRILPMYYLSLAFTFLSDVFIYKISPLSCQWLYYVFFLNMTIPVDDWTKHLSVNFFWTMPCFMAWYLIAPFVFKIFKNTERMAVAVLISGCFTPLLKKWMLTFACEQFVNWNFFCLLYDFLFGALAWFAIKENKKGRGLLYGILIFIAGWLVGNQSGFFVFGAFFYYIILGLNFLKIDWKYAKINTGIVTISSVTYSVYLFHYFILQIFGKIFRAIPWYVAYIIFVVVSFVLGYLLWRLVENPLGKYLSTPMDKKIYKTWGKKNRYIN